MVPCIEWFVILGGMFSRLDATRIIPFMQYAAGVEKEWSLYPGRMAVLRIGSKAMPSNVAYLRTISQSRGEVSGVQLTRYPTKMSATPNDMKTNKTPEPSNDRGSLHCVGRRDKILIHAARLLEGEAEVIRDCHTGRGRWKKEDEETHAKGVYDDLKSTAKQLRGLLSHNTPN